ncbi:MAG: NnrS family protein [Dehalococcoidia bacterium]
MTGPITSDSSVRDVVRRFPGSEQVFDRHGLAGCGGDNGPDEPIGFFAAIHHVDGVALLDELNAFAAASRSESGAPAAASATRPAYPMFVITALLLTLLVGLTTGVTAAMTDAYQVYSGEGWLALVQAHGHVQLFGFLGLFIMGIALHIVPRFKGVAPPDRRLILTVYGLMLGGALLRVNGQPHAQGAFRWVMALSGPVELAGGLLFAGLVARLLLRARDRREAPDRFLLAACGFLVLSLSMNAYQVIDAAVHGGRVVEVAGDEASVEAAMHGFVLLFILGVSFRVLPFFMRLPPAHGVLRDGSLALLITAVAARTAGLWAPAFVSGSWPTDLTRLSVAAEVVSILGMVFAIRIFEPALPGAPEGARTPHFGPMVRVAFLWLVAGAALESYWLIRELRGSVIPYYAAGALRHTILAGVAITMLVAMSYRTIPVFTGRALRWPRAVPVVFALVTAGAAFRVAPVAFGQVPSRLDYYFLGTGGVLLFAALTIVALQLSSVMLGWWQAPVGPGETEAPESSVPVNESRSGAARTAPQPNAAIPLAPAGARLIREDMTVAQALDVHPSVCDLLVDAGFQPLANPVTRAAMAPTITLERAAGMVGLRSLDLVDHLNLMINAALPAPEEGPAPIDFDLTGTEATIGETLEALSTCYDPEIPINIIELGLVLGVKVHGNYARAAITLTSPGCPAGDALVSDVEQALMSLPRVINARARIVFEPHWTPARMSRRAREALGLQTAR